MRLVPIQATPLIVGMPGAKYPHTISPVRPPTNLCQQSPYDQRVFFYGQKPQAIEMQPTKLGGNFENSN